MLEASRHRYDFAKQNLEAARARYAAGLVSVNDVTRVELEFATAEVGMTQVQGEVETTYLNLGFLMNGPTPRKLRVPDFLLQAADEKPPSAEKLVPEAQERRPDVKSLRMRAKAQTSLTIEPLLRWLPSLVLTGRYTYTNEAGLTGRNFNWNAGLTLNWSVFDGLTRNGDYSERKALAYQADLNLKAALRKVELDVRDARVSLESAQAVAQAWPTVADERRQKKRSRNLRALPPGAQLGPAGRGRQRPSLRSRSRPRPGAVRPGHRLSQSRGRPRAGPLWKGADR